MIALTDFVGQVLDGKYRLERLLGQGGMGTVYLATHLGTERYVALKLITAQLMSNVEFVERFKREARAAGRLRHPNVVDVTDFGFAQVDSEPVAYLVMEYLDGCTLADVLSEERRLPLEWVVDILEQVCSAVHEAHQQGIVHRDLKPENIWLEPNRLGGYRVKVLDFGIAKLAEQDGSLPLTENVTPTTVPYDTGVISPRDTAAPVPATFRAGLTESMGSPKAATDVKSEAETLHLSESGPDLASEAETTRILPEAANEKSGVPGDGEQTLKLSPTTDSGRLREEGQSTKLTRIGAIMGTPIYMSPEQCAGKHLDERSDLYSLGVIAYQMLTGEPPFRGETKKVLREHVESPPSPVSEHVKVPKRVASLVMSALAKDPAERPRSAIAFANSLRAQSEGIGALYRRAFALYSEYFPKFLRMSLIAHIPVIICTFAVVGLQIAERAQPRGYGAARITILVFLGVFGLLSVASYFVAAAGISGMTAVIVTQLEAAPLRPVELRTAFSVLKQRWKPFLKTAIRVTLRIVIGYILLVIPGIVMTVRYALYAPVVLVEGLEKKAAMQRARALASRSWRIVIIVSLLQILIPMIVSTLISIPFNSGQWKNNPTVKSFQQLGGLVNIFIVPLMSIVPALLYLKMRQIGGESLSGALAKIEELDTQRSSWQQRMRRRLTGASGSQSKN